jgi:hypothetical protein
MDDLVRILGYRDAHDPAFHPDSPPRVVGPDLLAVPFWTPSFCTALIRAAEATGAFEPQPDDPVPGDEVSLAVISPRLYGLVEADLGRRIWPVLQHEWPYIEFCGLRDAFVIRYARGGQEHLRIHHDVAQVSASVKLNDDYTGGELSFPRQAVTNEQLAVGELLVWPSLVTHPHETLPLRSGTKYGLTIWFELPGQYGSEP